MLHRRRPTINYMMLLQITGWLLGIEALFMLIPAAVALAYGESDSGVFAITAAITGIVGLYLTRCIHPATRHLGKRDGFLLTAMVWVVFSIFGMVPFLVAGPRLDFSAAYFEAMSGFTTTGVSTIEHPEALSHGMHLWRALMQWLGGMGIILFTLAVIPLLNHSGGLQMFNAEVTGITHDKIRPRISQTAKTLWGIYVTLTVTLTLLLWAGPMDLFQSICHAMGTLSTGGYMTEPDGISGFGCGTYLRVVLILFMFLGGVNFGLIFKTFRGDFKALGKNEVFRAFVIAIGVYTLLLAICAAFHGGVQNWEDSLLEPLFQCMSTITSTGVPSDGFVHWGPLAIALTLAMMLSGGCAGSTSGGAKIDRLLVFFKHMRNEVYRAVYPNSIRPVVMDGQILAPELVNKVVAFMGFYIMIVLAGVALLAIGGTPVWDGFFASFSCICNTGFGTHVVGLSTTFSSLPSGALWVLCLEMLTGRLEIFTILVLMMPSFWRR